MNWDDVRLFLIVSQSGTLSGAAKRLHVDQTTVGRRLTSLETKLGSTLFLRTNAGLVLTATGQKVIDIAKEMEQLALSFEKQVSGEDDCLEGEVRLTTTDTLTEDFVLPALQTLSNRYPDIKVILSTTTQQLDIVRREADIAIRTLRPTQQDLIVRQLGCWEVGLYATKAYLEKYGEPSQGDGFKGHNIALYQKGVTQRQDGYLVGESRENGRVVAEFNSSAMLTRYVRSGLAIAELPSYHTISCPELVRVWPNKKRAYPFEAWLVLHQDLSHTARVKVVVNEIVKSFQSIEHKKAPVDGWCF
ncbi:LysR family transcriptional regulator [Vibrio sp. S4M6]|uniref:LysR family transcriptional regulator n=1 Tax=Vibrio sinus TaxID=2946865 RepID=UPI00202A01AF|nr:LysR family transcriptional regulator [Vibrio sinus]MCL9779852.1 LysR family transcriptional regulator [Vibrio sinus]